MYLRNTQHAEQLIITVVVQVLMQDLDLAPLAEAPLRLGHTPIQVHHFL